MDKAEAVFAWLRDSGWLSTLASPKDVSFLAAGEYNENYLVRCNGRRYVFRINHGSQLGLPDQIGYEYGVLDALQDSGVTPRPFRVEPAAEGLGGVLLMEFLPGRPLNYRKDWKTAAHIFARIHSRPTDSRLLVQAHPVRDIADESIGLLNRFPDHPLRREYRLLLAYHENVMRLAEEVESLFRDEKMVIVNTEVNSHNFLIDDRLGYLVDWEKAVVSCRYQDLGHFLVPTTTRWKTDYTFGPRRRREFLREYLAESGLGLSLEDVDYRTKILERTILLRALSWCFMAFYEYTREDRALSNSDTFEKIKTYLGEIECILQ